MNTSRFTIAEAAASFGRYQALALEDLRQRAPAVFAPAAHESTSRRYGFIPTERVLSGLMDAGFVPVAARQSRTRVGSALHARHLVRLRRRVETVALRDCIPEIVLLNSHDGTSAYQLRAGLFRLVCLNGLMVAVGEIASLHVAHRGDVIEDVIAAALKLSEQFGILAGYVARMEARLLIQEERHQFALRALALRFEPQQLTGLATDQVLLPRRAEDAGQDLWRTFNVVQENVLRGGLLRRAASGRLTRTRGISAIREDVRLNTGLWEMAVGYLTN